MVVYNELFTKLKELLFPDYIYYNTEQYYMDENGFIIRDSKMNDGKINYEIHDVIPQNVKAEIELIIKINNIDKEIMQKIISQLEMSKTFFQNRSSKGLLCLDNPNFNDRYNEYLIIVKDRQKQLINIYEELKLKYFPINKKISYKWQVNPDIEIPELYNLMINEYALIAPETKLEQFIDIFTGKPIADLKPVRWHQNNATELLYFITKLEETNNISYNSKKSDYIKLTACFVMPDGKPFKASWKQIKTNLDISLSPEKIKAIDDLLINF